MFQDITFNWGLDHFKAFLFLTAAECDYSISPEELQLIVDYMSDQESGRDVVLEVIEGVADLKPEQKEQLFYEIKERFELTPEMKQEVLEEMEEIIMADETVGSEEVAFYGMVKRALRN